MKASKNRRVMAGVGAALLAAGATGVLGSAAFGDFSPSGGTAGSGGTGGSDQGYSQGYDNGYSAGAVSASVKVGGGTNAIFSRTHASTGADTNFKVTGKNSNRGANGGRGGRGGTGANHF